MQREKRQRARERIDLSIRNAALQTLGKSLPSDEQAKMLTAIGHRLNEWVPRGGELSFLAWLEYEATGVLPFQGGFLEQPLWVQQDFTLYRDIKMFHYLNEQLRSPQEVPDARYTIGNAEPHP